MKEKQIDLKGRTIKEVRDNGKSLTVAFETKWEPKPGDVCESGDGVIFIYKYKDWDGAIFYSALYEDRFYIDAHVSDRGFRPATREERCKFFERLVKEGYKWNAKKLKLTKVEKWEPKDGDFVVNKDAWVSIYKGNGITSTCISDYCGCWLDGFYLGLYPAGNRRGRDLRAATNANKQFLLDALKKAGKTWNAEKKCVDKLRWRAELGGTYCFVYTLKDNGRAFVHHLSDTRSEFDNNHYDSGNYYTAEDAKKAADRINAIFNENK